MKIVVNGKFLEQRVTGVQRVARELLQELDKICGDLDIDLVYSSSAKDIPQLNNVKSHAVGKRKGNLWEQLDFASYVRKNNAVSLNLCNSAPLFANKIVFVHDMKIKSHPEYYSKKFVLWYRVLFHNVMKKAKAIVTVSEFSKREIVKYYKVKPEKISVIGCGWQHYLRVNEDENVLGKYGLKEKEYCFTVSSLEPNKNLNWIIEVAKRNPRQTFIVAGGINKSVFGRTFSALPENVRLIGYATDEEVKSLMRSCKLFLFPTFYEGFGIPPLEALSAGAKIAVTDSETMREVLGNCAVYVRPDAYDYDIEALAKKAEGLEGSSALNKYAWEKSAKLLKELLIAYSEKK